MLRALLMVTCLSATAVPVLADIVVDFEELPVPGGYYNGDPSATGSVRDNYTVLGTEPSPFGGESTNQQWTADGVVFNNTYTVSPPYTSWSGWSWSNVVDSDTQAFTNQYASFPGGGSNGSGGVDAGGIYAVAFDNGAYFNLPDGSSLKSVDVTNTTFAALTMQNGDSYSKKFGGTSGFDPDYFKVTFTGHSGLGATGDVTGSTTVDLADYTFADKSLDYILDDWLNVDLTSLGDAKSVDLTFASSDVIGGDVITPTYVAIDNLTLTAVPEPSMVAAMGLASCMGAGIHWRRRRNRNRQAAVACP